MWAMSSPIRLQIETPHMSSTRLVCLRTSQPSCQVDNQCIKFCCAKALLCLRAITGRSRFSMIIIKMTGSKLTTIEMTGDTKRNTVSRRVCNPTGVHNPSELSHPSRGRQRALQVHFVVLSHILYVHYVRARLSSRRCSGFQCGL